MRHERGNETLGTPSGAIRGSGEVEDGRKEDH